MFPVERKRRREMPTVAAEAKTHRNDETSTCTSTTVGSDRTLAIGNAKRQNQPMALRGVVACFSGFSLEEKDRYHEAVVGLGGEYTRELNLSLNTHLIAREAQGPKYDAAKNAANLAVVRLRWLEECLRLRCRVDERRYGFETNESSCSDAPQVSPVSLHDSLELALRSELNSPSTLFSAGSFYMLGFSEKDKSLRNPLGKMLHRGMGTIYWEYHSGISHVIVNDGADNFIRDSVKALSLDQTEACHFVSPWWVVRSMSKGGLVPEHECPPIHRDGSTAVQKKNDKKLELTSNGKALLKGSLFCLLRVTPPEWAVDFDSKQVEHDILSNGGKLLSLKLVEALKVDHAPTGFVPAVANSFNAPINAPSAKRTCYVVAWGGATQAHLDIHPLLSQIKRQSLCHLVQVTPIWLSTCISEQRLLQPSRTPCLFEPGKRPIHCLFPPIVGKGSVAGDASSENAKPRTVRISVTGFSGSIRTALMHAIKAIGATYDDSMRSTTTHLICREASGAKYEKAVEWRLLVVSLEWLFHVMQYGFEGEKGLKGGCESEFSIDPSRPGVRPERRPGSSQSSLR